MMAAPAFLQALQDAGSEPGRVTAFPWFSTET